MPKRLARLFLIGALIAAVAGGTRLRAAADGEKGFQGAWDATITGSPFRILRSVSPESLVDSYAFPPFSLTPGVLVNSSGHGAWKKTGPREYTVVLRYLQLNPSAGFGLFDSYGVVRETVTISKDGDSYTSAFETEIFHPDGTSTGIVNAGTTTATRIQVP